MGAKRKQTVLTTNKVAAIITLDPAAVGSCGIALRLTAGLDRKTQRGKLRAPDWMYEGNVFNTRMHDELAVFLAEKVGREQRVLLAVEDAVFGPRTVARHLGRAIGCIEGLLCDLNLAEPDDTKYIFPGHYRKVTLPAEPKPANREEWKQAAIDTVATLYGLTCGDNQAEAILMNDYTIVAKRQWWFGSVEPEAVREAA